MGGSGSNSDNLIQANGGYQVLNGQAGAISDPAVLKAMQAYSSGQMSLQDAIKAATTNSGGTDKAAAKAWADNQLKDSGGFGGAAPGSQLYNGAESQLEDQYAKDHPGGGGQYDQSIANQFFSNPLTGSKIASSQVQNDPILSSMFGANGTMQDMAGQEKDLLANGFKMNNQDNTAYGQASDNIARMYGQQGNNVMQNLASHGLASGPNGASGVAFSGLQGNQNEQLAQAQMQIAQNRITTNQNMLQQVRGDLLQANQQGQSAINSQFNRNVAGVDNYQNSLKDSLNAAGAGQKQANEAFQQQQETKGPSVGDVLGGVAMDGIGTIGSAVTGGIGGALANSAKSAVSGALAPKPNYSNYNGIN